MRTMNRTICSVAVVALASFLEVGAASAQLAPSAANQGAAGIGTATARHFGAIAVNPAGLGMPGAGFSLSPFGGTVRQGLGPIGLKDLKDVEGQLVSSTVKEDWLGRVSAEGQQAGSVGAEGGLALTFGRIGFQVSTLAGGNMSLAPDIVEVMLYGNAGRNGTPANLSLANSSLEGFAVTTAGLSFGLPITASEGAMAIGATVKYSVGHAVAVGRDAGGSIQADPIRVNVNFPTVTVDDEDYSPNIGNGIGVDVGFQMQKERIQFGVAVQNLFNTFAWDDTKLVYYPMTAVLEQGNNETDTDKQAYASAPAGLRDRLDEMKFSPALAVGVAYDLQPDFTLSADVRNRFGEGISVAPKLHAGVGAEYRGLGALHLRGGGAVVTDGIQFGGGASLLLGPVNLSFGGAMLKGDLEDTSIAQFSISFGGR